MRVLYVALIALVCSPVLHAEAAQRQPRTVRSAQSDTALPPEALQAQQQAQRQAAQVQSRMQAMQQFLDREEQMLNRRLQYAQQLRQKGLPGNDMKLLKQAEQLERQAIATYEARVKQFEQYQASTGSPAGVKAQPRATQAQPRATQPQPRTRQAQPRAPKNTSTGSPWNLFRLGR